MARIMMDQSAGQHVSQRIQQRIPVEHHQTLVKAITKLIGMEAPDEAVGHYN